ncbi:MAG: nucleotidyltransferase family protein [Deltaproteobacteria bacterium]
MHLAAIVLAAGRSQRFGVDNKLLARLADGPVIAHSVAALADSSFRDIIVVTGDDHDGIADALRKYPVRLVRCDPDRSGIGYSIAAGVNALSDQTIGVAILLGDMPLIRTATLNALADAFIEANGRRIVHAADREGRQRNPVIWPRNYFPDLRSLTQDRGAKGLIRDAVAVTVRDRLEFLDVDTIEALDEAWLELIFRETEE